MKNHPLQFNTSRDLTRNYSWNDGPDEANVGLYEYDPKKNLTRRVFNPLSKFTGPKFEMLVHSKYFKMSRYTYRNNKFRLKFCIGFVSTELGLTFVFWKWEILMRLFA